MRALILCAVVAICAACPAGVDDTGPYREAVLASWGERVLMPLHEAIATDTQALADDAIAACATRQVIDATTIEGLRARWQTAHASMKRLEVLRFGPQVDITLQLGQRLDFWPARKDRIIAVLNDDSALTPERFANEGAVVRGLPVLEVLLWPDNDQDAAMTASLYINEERRCGYLMAATADAASLAAGLRDTWAPNAGNFLAEVVSPQPGGFFAGSTLIAFSELVNRLGFSTENIRRDKLGRTSPDNVEASPSDGSTRAMRDVLDGMRKLIVKADGGTGLLDHPRFAERADLADALVTSLDNADAAIAAIPPPFRVAVVNNRTEIATAETALVELQRVIQVDVMNVLGLTLSFNDADGD